MKKMYFPILSDFDKQLPYFFAGVGYAYEQEEIKRPTRDWRQQWMLDNYQWIQTHKGKGELILNGNRYIIKEGQGFLLFPNEPHEYRAIDGIWETDWIIFDGKYIDDFIRNTLGTSASSPYYIYNHKVVSDRIGRLYNTAVSSSPIKNLSCSGLIYEILLNIYTLISQRQNTALINSSKKLEPVMNYIHSSYAQPVSLTELADIADLTPQYLCRLFKKITSQTVFDYLNALRIQKSKELLLSEPNMTIKEIALNTGFGSDSYFCHVFGKFEHMSPARFRDLNSMK